MKRKSEAMKKKACAVAKPHNDELYQRIREILESAKAGVARTVNSAQVVANWLIGREIVEEEQKGAKRAGYGEELLQELSTQLVRDFGRGYSVVNLLWFRRFYGTFPELLGGGKSDAPRQVLGLPRKSYAPRKKLLPGEPMLVLPEHTGKDWRAGCLNPNLSWTHYRTLLRVESPGARSFYEIEAVKNGWSARELERQINSLLFERLAKSKDKTGLMRLALKGHEVQKPGDVFKDPVVMEFLGLPESPQLVESELEQALINNLQLFLLELGKGFAFVSRQERLTLDGDHFYVDLVFYHTVLKCYVLIDLKIGKLTHGDLGQLQLYVNYFDRERRTEGDNPTLGLILCTDKNDAMVKYTLGEELEKKIFASRYKLHLPSETELKAEIKRELRVLKKP